MKTAALVFAVALVPCAASAQRARSPADATVFIRLIGTVHAEIDDGGIKRTVDVERVEIGTGSGFVISPHGYVVTNAHVVESGDPLRLTRGPKSATITLKVSAINVCFTAEAMAARGQLVPCAEASVAGADRDRDLAILFVSGSANLPYLPLGDSDVVAAGLPVEALGYPFGREVEIGKVAAASDLVPEVSATPGSVSALRASDAGERRYLQITNSVNPGNSGGPILNRDGFVVGVVHSKLAKAAAIGFAIPINDVKDLLDAYGLDQAMPVRRLRLGALQSVEGKGLSVRLPEGFADRSPFASRVETDAPAKSRSVSTAWSRRGPSNVSRKRWCRPGRSRRSRWRRARIRVATLRDRPCRAGCSAVRLALAPIRTARSGWTMPFWSWAPRSWSPATSARRRRWLSTRACCVTRLSAFRASRSCRRRCRPWSA